MDKKIILLSTIIVVLGLSEHAKTFSSEVAEGIFGGGFLGAAIGGAAGGGRGAAIGAGVGAGLGAISGAAARSRREREYLEDPEILYEQNEELRYENKRLIYKHKRLVQRYERYQWILDKCRKGKTNYRKRARELVFEDDTNYSKYRRWKFKGKIHKQNNLLAKANSQLRSKNKHLREKIRQLKKKLRKCEE